MNVAVFRDEISRCYAVEYSSSVLSKSARILLYALLDNIHHAFCYAITPSIYGLRRAKCSSVVTAYAHGVMDRRIDPSWGFLSHCLSGSLPYVRRDIIVNKMC